MSSRLLYLLAIAALSCGRGSPDAKSPCSAVSAPSRAQSLDDRSGARAIATGTAAVPPPPVGATDNQPPELKVRLNASGSLAVSRNGAELGTVSSPSQLATLVPRCTSDQRVILVPAPTVGYGAITAAMDELYALGCSEISFAMTP